MCVVVCVCVNMRGYISDLMIQWNYSSAENESVHREISHFTKIWKRYNSFRYDSAKKVNTERMIDMLEHNKRCAFLLGLC